MAFRLAARAKSFLYAFKGIASVLRTQHNAWIHALATLGVIVAGIYCRLAGWEWCAITFAIGLVWVAECLNTALEFLADEVSAERRKLIGKAKDAAAGGVLIAAICSVIIALLIFPAHLFK